MKSKKENLKKSIIYNAIKTPDGTILHSKYTHDCVIYTDKNKKVYGVDGGNEYLRRIGEVIDCEDLSKYDDGKFRTRRKYLIWESRYDENMNLLPETLYSPVKDLKINHIKAILKTQKQISSIYKDTFEKELKYRKSKQLIIK